VSGVEKMKKKFLLVVISLILICSLNTVFGQCDPNSIGRVVQKEVDKGNQIILDKIQLESDACYNNVEQTATKYFWEIREDFKKTFWTDRIVQFIGMYLSFVLAFLTVLIYWNRLEKKKLAVKYGK